jgi:hypothetical protein
VPTLRGRPAWCCALLQLPGQPPCSPSWGTRSPGTPLDASHGRGCSASTVSSRRSSLLCRSTWCRVRLPSPPPWGACSLETSLDSSCNRGRLTSSLGPWTVCGSSLEASSVPPSLCLSRSAASPARTSECPASTPG